MSSIVSENIIDYAIENIDCLRTMLAEMPVFVDKTEQEAAFVEEVRSWLVEELSLPFDTVAEAIDDDSLTMIMAEQYE